MHQKVNFYTAFKAKIVCTQLSHRYILISMFKHMLTHKHILILAYPPQILLSSSHNITHSVGGHKIKEV